MSCLAKLKCLGSKNDNNGSELGSLDHPPPEILTMRDHSMVLDRKTTRNDSWKFHSATPEARLTTHYSNAPVSFRQKSVDDDVTQTSRLFRRMRIDDDDVTRTATKCPCAMMTSDRRSDVSERRKVFRSSNQRSHSSHLSAQVCYSKYGDHPPFPSTKIIIFDLNRPDNHHSRGLGISLVSYQDLDGVSGIFVGRVISSEAVVYANGSIEPGDRLLEVNGHGLSGVRNGDVIRLVTSEVKKGGILRLLLLARAEDDNTASSGISSTRISNTDIPTTRKSSIGVPSSRRSSTDKSTIDTSRTGTDRSSTDKSSIGLSSTDGSTADVSSIDVSSTDIPRDVSIPNQKFKPRVALRLPFPSGNACLYDFHSSCTKSSSSTDPAYRHPHPHRSSGEDPSHRALLPPAYPHPCPVAFLRYAPCSCAALTFRGYELTDWILQKYGWDAVGSARSPREFVQCLLDCGEILDAESGGWSRFSERGSYLMQYSCFADHRIIV